MCTIPQLKKSLLRTIQVLLFCIFGTIPVFAQHWDGKDLELSLSGGLKNFRNGNNFFTTYFISPRLGCFVVSGLEIEPELSFLVTSGSHPLYMLNGDVSYNFNTDKNGIPFVLVGYGLANTYPIIKNDIVVGVLNVGVGVKIFLEEGPTFRVEYRYQNFSSPSSNDEVRIHTVHFGFVILSQ